MSATDYLRLGEHKLFKEAIENLPKNVSKTLNLLTVRDNVVFTWDFQNHCVLSLNVKAARSKDGDNVTHQKLLPLSPPLFVPEFLLANDSCTLLAVAGPNGVLVFQLPMRCAPYGAFDSNKEVVYCRSHSLDERLLACNELLHVKQVKFHPGSVTDSHVVVLTSDNMLRLYHIENNEAFNLAVYAVGENPGGRLFPGSKTHFLDMFGEIAVDFDFGQPELVEKPHVHISHDTFAQHALRPQITTNKIVPNEAFRKKTREATKKEHDLVWPVYVLHGDCSVFSINIDLTKRSKAVLKGPLPMTNNTNSSEACSLLCRNTTPQIFCIAMSNGTILHSVLLDVEDERKNKLEDTSKSLLEMVGKELLTFEIVELQVGLTLLELESSSSSLDEHNTTKCAVYLHKDESQLSRYFATHSGGVHSVDISCLDELNSYVSGPEDGEPSPDLFNQASTVEYVVCTKTASSEKSNPVVGFSLYYEPTSVMALLGDGNLVTLAVLTVPNLPKIVEDLTLDEHNNEQIESPLKKMLKEPFDEYIQKILKKASNQPVLKLSSDDDHSPQQSYQLLQRASQVFREEHFRCHRRAREELEKRIHTLSLLKDNQQKEIEKMIGEKDTLKEKAEGLAEKYEDIKDKQDDLMKRCEQLLMLVSRKKCEPSDAEKKFMEEMNRCSEKAVVYGNAIDKLKNKIKYQQVQMDNWKAKEQKKVESIGEMPTATVRQNLHDTTIKIANMQKAIREYKSQLNVK